MVVFTTRATKIYTRFTKKPPPAEEHQALCHFDTLNSPYSLVFLVKPFVALVVKNKIYFFTITISGLGASGIFSSI